MYTRKKTWSNPHQHVQVLTYAAVQIHILTVLVQLHVATVDTLFSLTSLPKPDFLSSPTASMYIHSHYREMNSPSKKEKRADVKTCHNLLFLHTREEMSSYVLMIDKTLRHYSKSQSFHRVFETSFLNHSHAWLILTFNTWFTFRF